ncbi:hypothetical protein Acr_14g0007480 [Actinidia rufa]|uniref:Uncharacterized protein n=1 Tax=Actinidia rufa TaxID=165716 RepID=A0A7J0FQX4_9ERIC|nr:hypothetical protein Acr_14g0007480 [Actinidia rufa]
MGFLTRIWAEHLPVSYTHDCLVSTSGFPQALCINRAQVLLMARPSNKQERKKEIIALRSLHHIPSAVVLPLRIGGALPPDTDMALNRAQMLVRDSEALAQFRVDHRIPDDVVIERPGPNDDADWVEGVGNRMPIRTWFIYQAGLRFPLSKLLRSVLSICGLTFMQVSVNFVRTVLAVEALMQREGLEFTAEDLFHVYCVEFPVNEPDPFSVPRHRGYVPVAAISAVNNCGRSRKVSDLLGYIPLYRYTIPLRAAHQGRPVLPPLQIRGPGPRPRSSLFDEVSDLFEGTLAELRRLLEEAEGESSGSSESSSSSWDIDLGDEALNEEAEVEDGEEVDQIHAAAPLIVEHSYSHSDSSSAGSQLNAEIMAPKVRILGKKQGPTTEPTALPEVPISSTPVPVEDQSTTSSLMGGKRKGKQHAEGTSRPKRGKGVGLVAADTSKDHETCVALGNAVMLPQDVADHAAEPTAEFGGKLVMLGCQTQSELADARSAAKIAILQRNHAQQEASDLKAFACGEVYKKLFDRAFERAGDVYERQLAELRPGVFQEGWLACLKELQIPLDHPAWSSPAPPVQLPASPERYSPINLPDFNEEEYATLPAAEGNTNAAAVEAHVGAAETADRDPAGEAEGDRALEAEGENLV